MDGVLASLCAFGNLLHTRWSSRIVSKYSLGTLGKFGVLLLICEDIVLLAVMIPLFENATPSRQKMARWNSNGQKRD